MENLILADFPYILSENNKNNASSAIEKSKTLNNLQVNIFLLKNQNGSFLSLSISIRLILMVLL